MNKYEQYVCYILDNSKVYKKYNRYTSAVVTLTKITSVSHDSILGHNSMIVHNIRFKRNGAAKVNVAVEIMDITH